MEESMPPPNYSQGDLATADLTTEPQILIIPTVDGVNFQKGYLGAEGERAAIEGELQVKTAPPVQWDKVTISLRTLEMAYGREIELSFRELELYSATSHSDLPSTFPFAIPLMSDTPQSLQTPHSSLSHILTAALHPTNVDVPIITKSLTVHTKRYTSHTYVPEISPKTYVLEEPTRVEVQVPRTKFVAGNPIPLYVTIPPPTRELVVDDGLRLRNVQVEVIRVIEVKREDEESNDANVDVNHDSKTAQQEDGANAATDPATSSATLKSSSHTGSSYQSVVARSGASCRFHSSQPIQLRFILHHPAQQGASNACLENVTNADLGHSDCDEESPMISQSTLLHSVTFQIKIYISFVDTSTRTERISTLIIPIVMVPPPAPLPEISHSMDEAYSKKHDRPPTRTIREEENDAAPHYPGEAGPSMTSPGAPPPFEERDAPPPFFPTAEASGSHLPSFLESEREIILPDLPLDEMEPMSRLQGISGEGVYFGFHSSQQFDGHSEDMERLMTPPPSLEMANRDTNLTNLTDIDTEDALEALNLVLEQSEVGSDHSLHPPPPPAMDDPSDPPPSIDSDFRVPETTQGPPPTSPPPHSPPPRHQSYGTSEPPPPDVSSAQLRASHGHAPPPYLQPENHEEHVMRPPPYAD